MQTQFAPPSATRPTLTTWRNPLDVDQHIDVYEEGSGVYRRPDGRIVEGHVRYTIPAGGTAQIPSRHDRAIHAVHNGVIIGGLAPQLVREGAANKLDPALDPKAAEEAAKAKRAAEVEAYAVAAREAAREVVTQIASAPAPRNGK